MDIAQVKRPRVLTVWTKPNNIALLTIAGILLHLFFRYLLHAPRIAWQVPLIVVLIVGGVPLPRATDAKTFCAGIRSDHLAGISIITSIILCAYLVAAIVILMLSGGTAFEVFASRRASSVLDALAKRMPQVAHRKCGPDLSDVRLGDIVVGDTLVVFPHEICSVDGATQEERASRPDRGKLRRQGIERNAECLE
jgi:cation transport ATPase